MPKKTLIAACAAALALIVAVFVVSWAILFHSFSNIEAEEARQSTVRARLALQTEARELRVVAQDNGQWDESYAYVQGERPTFVDDNLGRKALDPLDVQLIWLFDDSGRALVKLTTHNAPAGKLTELSPETLRTLGRYAKVLAPDSGPVPTARLMRLPDGVIVFSAVRVRRTDRLGPGIATLVFGRYLDAAIVRRIEAASQTPVNLIVFDERGVAETALPEPVTNWLRSAGSRTPQKAADDTFVLTRRGPTLASYALLRDIEGRPVLLLVNEVSRVALQLGKRTIMWIVVVLAAGFAVLVAVLLTQLNKSWRARVLAQRQWLEQQRKMSRLARRDSLTGLPNRVHLQRVLPRLLKRAQRERSPLALLYIDLDHFKNVNDSLGHRSGDKLLATIAQRLRSCVAAHDLVVRMGGDEFVVVVMLLPDEKVVNSIAERITAALALPMDVDGVRMAVSPSIGISVFPEDGSDPEQLLKQADIALYHAKDRGRGHHQFFTPELNTRLRERVELEQAMRRALEGNEFSVAYQPCYDLQSRRVVSLEALIRWRGPDGSFIPPSRFIPVAEESGLIVEIGAWVLRDVCLQLSEWQRAHVPLVPVSVNISVRQLEQVPLANIVSGLAQELGIDADLLHFEITESAAMQNSEQHLGSLQALRRLGSRILIDDFGTGYSSLSYLKHLPIDTLKIDRAFVRDMVSDANDAAIVRAIVAVAKSLGLQLVAEGIESAEQLDSLAALGCECGQGFYLSPPLAADSCAALLWQLRGQPRGADHRLRLLNPSA